MDLRDSVGRPDWHYDGASPRRDGVVMRAIASILRNVALLVFGALFAIVAIHLYWACVTIDQLIEDRGDVIRPHFFKVEFEGKPV